MNLAKPIIYMTMTNYHVEIRLRLTTIAITASLIGVSSARPRAGHSVWLRQWCSLAGVRAILNFILWL